MSRTKLISYISIGLLISNLTLIVFIFFNRQAPPFHEGPRDIIIERLHFDKKQIEDYDTLIFIHRKEIQSKESEILSVKNLLYNTLTNNTNPSEIDSLKKEIGKLQIAIENIHYKHFQDIEQLCSEKQKPYFNELIKDIAQLFAKPKGRPDKR